jgi:hypothetical protein
VSGDVLLVVACAAAKRQHPAPAAKLYCSNNFAFMLSAARCEAAETTRICGLPAGVAILSALHGLVDLDTVIAPYDLKMGQPGSCNPERVAAQLSARRPDQIIALLPAAYLRVLAAGIHIVNEAGTADIELMDAFEAAPGIGYQRGVAASLLRRAGSIGRQPQHPRLANHHP